MDTDHFGDAMKMDRRIEASDATKRREYTTPKLRELGSATELTRAVQRFGMRDGGRGRGMRRS